MPVTNRRSLHRFTALVLVAASHASAADNAADTAARIDRIEHGLRQIDAARQDIGPPQSIAQRMAALDVPGLSIVVFDEGRILWARGYGLRDVETQSPVDAGTLFQAASISKPVASAGLFRLVENGTLTLDENINDRLRRWQVPDNAFTATEKVTPRRIITHTAGLTVHGFAGYAAGAPVPTAVQILDGLPPSNSPPTRVDIVPGTRERYSGGGFTALQLLMEDVSGQSFADLQQTLVLQPAGMADSSYAQPLPPALAARAATGYDGDGEPVPGRHHTYPELAAAGLWTTPSDLARFMLAIGRSYRGEPDGLLQPSSARTMLTKVPNGSGQGFGLSGDGAAFRYRHSGGNAGFSCYAAAFADSGRGIVLMTNSDVGDALINEVARAVSREYGWPPLTIRD